MSKPAKQKYRTKNWAAYTKALRAKGLLTMWLDREMAWQAGPVSGKPWRPEKYSDAAVQCCLTMKVLFGLALRQTHGFVQSVLELSGLDWQAPDYSTMSRNGVGDAPMLPELLGQIPAEEAVLSVSGNGAHDTQHCYDAIAERSAEAVIPTRKNAQPWKAKRPAAAARNETLRVTNRLGQGVWKKWSGYRSLVETKMRCFKLLGERMMARTFERQVVEFQVRAAVLNRFTHLGTPVRAPWPNSVRGQVKLCLGGVL